MNHKTRGIVIKTVAYGETSVVVHVYTELFGMQAYLVNGVRVSSKKGHGKGNLFQPTAILDLVVYHNELKNLQRIREFRWGHLYANLLSDVFRNAVAQFMIELVYKTIKQPETNESLYHFVEDALIHLDKSDNAIVANFPLYFALHLTAFFGFQFSDSYSDNRPILDLKEGEFIPSIPPHPYFLDSSLSFATAQIMRARHPEDLREIKLNQTIRRSLLHAYEQFYALHLQDFGTLKTLPVLEAVLG